MYGTGSFALSKAVIITTLVFILHKVPFNYSAQFNEDQRNNIISLANYAHLKSRNYHLFAPSGHFEMVFVGYSGGEKQN